MTPRPLYAGQRLDPDRAAALNRLHMTITTAIEDGSTIPCVHDDDPDRWISDDLDVQREAAASCFDCPLMTGPCETYVSAHPERAGVWAGLIPTGRNQK